MGPKLAMSLAFSVAAFAQAASAAPAASHGQHGARSSTACDAARLSLWFDAQRRLTDGNVGPTHEIALPAECGKQDVAAGADAGTVSHEAQIPAQGDPGKSHG